MIADDGLRGEWLLYRVRSEADNQKVYGRLRYDFTAILACGWPTPRYLMLRSRTAPSPIKAGRSPTLRSPNTRDMRLYGLRMVRRGIGMASSPGRKSRTRSPWRWQ